MPAGSPKQFQLLAGKPMLWHALRALDIAPIEMIFVVLGKDDREFRAQDWSAFAGRIEPLYCGGETRAESVHNGLIAAMAGIDADDWVLVHDAARPCLPRADLERLIGAAVSTFGRLDVMVNNAGIGLGLVPITELTVEAWNQNLDVMALGTMLGSAGCIVMEEGTDMVWVLATITRFYANESCGQCTPCREGTGWLYRMVHRIEHGKGRLEDLDLLDNVSDNIAGRTICALGDAAALPVKSFIKHFRDEFVHHIEHKKCLVPDYI